MKFLKWLGVFLILLIIAYFLGPRPATPQFNNILPFVPPGAEALEKYVQDNEAAFKLKPDNEARIIWNDTSKREPTEYSVVYLHGFSASQEEGDPAHLEFARNFGLNLYLSRLSDHGIDTNEPLLDFTADRVWTSAKQAYAIGKRLGKKVILMGTSTGGTLALKLAAEFPEIAGLILLSPNIAINDPNAWMLNNQWGLQFARAKKGKYNRSRDTTAAYAKYWYPYYRMEAAVQLEELLETTMKNSTFEKIKQPTLILCYFKDDEHQDEVVKVSAMKRMSMQLATPDSLKRIIAIPRAGDHVIGSYIKSKDVESVHFECQRFGREVLKLPVPF